jgi:hypothetical protein
MILKNKSDLTLAYISKSFSKAIQNLKIADVNVELKRTGQSNRQ